MNIPEEFDYLEINNEFEQALDSILNKEENVLITGPGGAGKTEVLQLIKSMSDETTIFLAPTGVASVRIGGQTIHSFFKLPPSYIKPEDCYKENDEDMHYLMKRVKRIIIDEISMVRVEVLDAIDRLLKMYRNKETKPFGGVQMILVGDLYQLPPIVGSDGEKQMLQELYKGIFFFNAYSFDDGNFKTIEFIKIYRQNNQEFVDVLNRIRKGLQEPSDLHYINKKQIPEEIFKIRHKEKNTEYVYIASFNKTVNAINNKFLQELEGKEETFYAEIEGKINPKNFLAPEELLLKVGCKVMLLNNDSDKRWINGTMGIIDSFGYDNDGEDIIYVDIKGTISGVPKITLNNIEYEYDPKEKDIRQKIIGSYKQFPLKLGYACTTHKVQSATFESAYVDIGNYVFAEGLTYVALSRLSSLDGLGLKRKIQNKDIKINKEVVEFLREKI